MTLTKQTNKAIVKHILEVVFDLPADSELHKVLSQNNLFSLPSILAYDDANFDNLQFEENNKKTTIRKGTAGMIRSFKAFVAYQNAIGQPFQNGDWLNITQDNFDNFRILHINIAGVPIAPVSTRPAAQPDIICDFKCGIKRDTSQFIALKDDSAWDNWNRSTMAQARAQD